MVSQNVTSGGVATEPPPPTKVGSIFVGWYSDAGLITPFSFSTPIVANITLYAKWTTVPLPAPTIAGFTPTSRAAGSSLTITGTNFTAATSVMFNTTLATTFTVVSATRITATVPVGATTENQGHFPYFLIITEEQESEGSFAMESNDSWIK